MNHLKFRYLNIWFTYLISGLKTVIISHVNKVEERSSFTPKATLFKYLEMVSGNTEFLHVQYVFTSSSSSSCSCSGDFWFLVISACHRSVGTVAVKDFSVL